MDNLCQTRAIVVILKMRVIAYLYRISERQVEEATHLHLAIQEFVGRAVDELAPDHSIAAAIYTGDKAYDDTDLHYRLWRQRKYSALRLNDYRTAETSAHRAYGLQVQDSPAYQAGLAERYQVERKFGAAKRWHGLGRGRYLGLLRYGIQAHLTALVLNLKRIVTLLTGVRFRPAARKAELIAA